jgi:hypothetical protein
MCWLLPLNIGYDVLLSHDLSPKVKKNITELWGKREGLLFLTNVKVFVKQLRQVSNKSKHSHFSWFGCRSS